MDVTEVVDEGMDAVRSAEWPSEFLDCMPTGVAVIDCGDCGDGGDGGDGDLRVKVANRAFAALVTKTPAEVVGRTITALFESSGHGHGPGRSDKLVTVLRMSLQSGQAIADMELCIDPDRRFLMSCFPIEAAQAGKAGTAVGLSLRELPGERNGERTGDDSELRRREAVFHAIFDHTAVGLFVYDWQGGFSFNAAARAMLGYSADELANLGIRGITHPEDYERDLAQFGRLMSGEIDHYELHKRYLRKDGEFIWCRLFLSLARDGLGKPQLVIAAIEDVTEARRAEAAREAMISALKEAVSARELFLSVASHELKTPLTSLVANLEIIRAARAGRTQLGEIVSGQCEEARLSAASRQVDRLCALVDRLLDVSRIATGQLEISCARLDLVATVREVVERYRDEAAQAGCAVVLRAAQPVPVMADPLRMEQVLSNLLANAIKFGSGAPIEVSAEREEGRAWVIVRDNGIGIAPEDQARIFERFGRASSEMHYAGLGLGLYIAREIVEGHGGRISVESRPRAGATFRVELPARG